MTDTGDPGIGIVVAGIGNLDRGDDAAGRAVARCLRGRVPAGVTVVERGGESAEVIDAIAGASAAFIVDAVAPLGDPGAVHRVDAGEQPLPHHLSSGASTHGLGVAEAVELARTLGTLPPRLVFYGIESSTFDHGSPLSEAVRRSVDVVASRILDDIDRLTCEES